MLYTIFDIETTGLDAFRNDVIQFAYLKINDRFEKVDSGCLHFHYPGMRWGKEAEAIHHIPEASLIPYEKDFDDNIRRMYVLLSHSNVVGHNVNNFDYPFCSQFLNKFGMQGTVPAMSFDTMLIYKFKHKKRMKLGVLAEAEGFTKHVIDACCSAWFGETTQAHDARYDVTMTALLFMKAKNEGLI